MSAETDFAKRHPYATVHAGRTDGLAALGESAAALLKADRARQGEIREALLKLVASTIAPAPSVMFLNKIHYAVTEGQELLVKDHYHFDTGQEVVYLPTGHKGTIVGYGHGAFHVQLPSGHTFSASRDRLQPADWPTPEATKTYGGGSLQKRAPAVIKSGILKGQRIRFKNQGYPMDGQIGFVRETPAAGSTMISADWDSGHGQHGMALLYAHQFEIA